MELEAKAGTPLHTNPYRGRKLFFQCRADASHNHPVWHSGKSVFSLLVFSKQVFVLESHNKYFRACINVYYSRHLFVEVSDQCSCRVRIC